MRSSSPSELASLVVPNGASAVQPSAISHWQCSTKRSASGSPSSPKGVRTGAMTPEKCDFFCHGCALASVCLCLQAGMGMPGCGTGT